ncbi:Hypothetical predicted protein [Paramuricea clavata]|uniref:Uncharacterized protein n=1 Tax=Paramuricea clavata TaxID=317549 RepID=A0A7D9HWI6_PARCT|nr:Hypothetical predicted protein [Paramuricea clavata]
MPVTENVDLTIPSDDINLLHNLRHDGLSLFDALKCVRMSLVPEGYEPYPFRNVVEESQDDIIKSIVATYRFRATVAKCVSEGVDFSTHLYIPEIVEGTDELKHFMKGKITATF